MGMVYKLQDYAEAMGLTGVFPDWLLTVAAVALSTIELLLGVLLLFAISRRVVSRSILAFMVVMTLLTIWIYLYDPVSDCGCFGDAVKLTNGQTLLKNVVLLASAGVLAWRPLLMPRFISLKAQWMIGDLTLATAICISIYSIYDLPLIDFRPYYVGANIKQGMETPPDAEQPVIETTFILEKNGEQKEFTLDNYPDSTWTFIDSKSVTVKEGYVPPIHDFEIVDAHTGDDMTDDILSRKGYTVLLVAPHLEQADDGHFGEIDRLYEQAKEHKVPFYCVTASGDKGIQHWVDITGAEYPFCHCDDVTLKTIIRSNPGLVLLKNGVVVGKWSHNFLPEDLKLN